MMRKKVLLTKSINHLPGANEALMKEVEVIQYTPDTMKHLAQNVHDVHGIIAPDTVISESIIKASPLLQFIATPQVGFDKIDVEAATKAGIPVIANIGLTAWDVAEFTMGLIISLARRIVRSDHDLRQEKNWSIRAPYSDPALEMGISLYDSTVGVIGFGNIGSIIANLCHTVFSAHVLAYDPLVNADQMSIQGVEKIDNLITIAQKVDFLTVHTPLTNETKHMINEDVLRAMKRSAFLINCARGSVVDEKALIIALQEKWIAGAALDVFEEEPINPNNPLVLMPSVILTPHIAGVTIQSSVKRGEELVRRVVSVLSGVKPDGLVNPTVWPYYIKRLSKAKDIHR